MPLPAVFVVAVLAACLTSAVIGWQDLGFPDARDYLRAAEAIHQGTAYPRTGNSLPFFRPPGYPAFVAAVWWIAPDSLVAIKIAQAFVFAIMCCALAVLGELTLADLRGRWAGLLYAVNPFALHQTARIQTEGLFAALLALSVLLLVRALGRSRAGLLLPILSGLLLGWATLVRPVGLYLGLALALTASVAVLRRSRNWRSLQVGVGVLLGMAITILPWSVHNLADTGEFLLVNDAGGYALWAGNHPLNAVFFESPGRGIEPFNRINHKVAPELLEKWERDRSYSSLAFADRERLWISEAFANARSDPKLAVRLVVWKMMEFWRPWLMPRVYPMREVLLSAILLCLLYALAGYGALSLVRKGSSAARGFLWCLAGLTLTGTLAHAIVMAMMRYRLPIIDPYLHVLALAGFVAIVRR